MRSSSPRSTRGLAKPRPPTSGRGSGSQGVKRTRGVRSVGPLERACQAPNLRSRCRQSACQRLSALVRGVGDRRPSPLTDVDRTDWVYVLGLLGGDGRPSLPRNAIRSWSGSKLGTGHALRSGREPKMSDPVLREESRTPNQEHATPVLFRRRLENTHHSIISLFEGLNCLRRTGANSNSEGARNDQRLPISPVRDFEAGIDSALARGFAMLPTSPTPAGPLLASRAQRREGPIPAAIPEAGEDRGRSAPMAPMYLARAVLTGILAFGQCRACPGGARTSPRGGSR
jgi:hypothetical protein